MSEDRLESGMKVSEAVRKARYWWDDQGGRHKLSKKLEAESNQEVHGRRFTPSNNITAAILIPGDKQRVINSGILAGKPWEELDKREQLQIVKVWHRFHVMEPLRGVALLQ